MAWEERKESASKYYCRSVRVAGKVTRQYIGKAADVVVQCIAHADNLSRSEAEAGVSDVRSEQEAFSEVKDEIEAFYKFVLTLNSVCLAALGYHRQNKEWKAMKGNKRKAAREPESTDEQPTQELIQHLIQQSSRGDLPAGEQLRQIIRNNPEIWSTVGDLPRHAELSLIEMTSRGSVLLAESLKEKVRDLRESLRRGAIDNALEELLIDHIVVTYLELHYTRMAAIQPQQYARDSKFWEQRHEKSDARYRAAISELASVRKLLSESSTLSHDVPPAGEVNVQ